MGTPISSEPGKVKAVKKRNGYPDLFRAGEGESNDGEKWHPASVTLLPLVKG